MNSQLMVISRRKQNKKKGNCIQKEGNTWRKKFTIDLVVHGDVRSMIQDDRTKEKKGVCYQNFSFCHRLLLLFFQRGVLGTLANSCHTGTDYHIDCIFAILLLH